MFIRGVSPSLKHSYSQSLAYINSRAVSRSHRRKVNRIVSQSLTVKLKEDAKIKIFILKEDAKILKRATNVLPQTTYRKIMNWQ